MDGLYIRKIAGLHCVVVGACGLSCVVMDKGLTQIFEDRSQITADVDSDLMDWKQDFEAYVPRQVVADGKLGHGSHCLFDWRCSYSES